MKAAALATALLGLALLAGSPALADGPTDQPTSAAPVPPAAAAPPATARPAAPPAGPMILNLLAQPMESQEAAFRDSIRREVARAGGPGMPGDGTIRLGQATLTITVKDACPDGEPFHEAPLPRQRPGRTRR